MEISIIKILFILLAIFNGLVIAILTGLNKNRLAISLSLLEVIIIYSAGYFN